MRLPPLVSAFACIVLSALAALVLTSEALSSKRRVERLERGDRYLLSHIHARRQQTWRWQQVMGRPLTRAARGVRHSRSPHYRRWVLRLWHRRAVRARRQAASPPHRDAWLCIHRYEGSWNARTGNGYYGGLQMDVHFQAAYGSTLLRRKGTADNWTPLEQMWVAERALQRGRGFYPWPNTARYCGLL